MKYITIVAILILLSFTTNAYDTQSTFDYLYYSKNAYCDEQKVKQWNCDTCFQQPGMKDVATFSNSKFKTFAYTGYNFERNEIVLAFRGTDNIRNWLSNLNAIKSKYSYCSKCKVHSGFNNSYGSLKQQVELSVLKLRQKYPQAQVVVTGHSLGGAIACLSAISLQVNHGVKIDYLYTYGQPRVGNKYFARFIDSIIPNYYRVVHYKDVVPHVPLSVMFFKHGGKQIHYNKQSLEYLDCSQQKCSHAINCQSVGNHLYYLNMSTDCIHKIDNEQKYFADDNVESKDEQLDNDDQFDLNMFGHYMDHESSFDQSTESEKTDQDFDEDFVYEDILV